MLQALLPLIDGRWARFEVPVHRPVRGMIDPSSRTSRRTFVATELQSQIRRLEQ
jgi:hypothetical protein